VARPYSGLANVLITKKPLDPEDGALFVQPITGREQISSCSIVCSDPGSNGSADPKLGCNRPTKSATYPKRIQADVRDPVVRQKSPIVQTRPSVMAFTSGSNNVRLVAITKPHAALRGFA
jgi:hypothetical protein